MVMWIPIRIRFENSDEIVNLLFKIIKKKRIFFNRFSTCIIEG